MNAMVRMLLSACVVMVLTAAIAVAGPLEDGIEAYRSQDYAKAVELLRPLAEKGDPAGQYVYGTLFMEGKGVERNDETAFAWFLRAANQGNPSAQYAVGASYAEGTGIAKNYAEAAKWFLRAANQGMEYAQLNLGLLYASGAGVPQDNVEAFKWLELALFALPAGGARSDVARAMQDVAAKMKREDIQEAQRRERQWKAKAETKPDAKAEAKPEPKAEAKPQGK